MLLLSMFLLTMFLLMSGPRQFKAVRPSSKIWPSVNRIVERMLARRVELMDAYEEIYSSLAGRPRALTAF